MTTTRRKLIVGAAALPLLPATALAVPVTLPLLPVASYAEPAAPDPILAPFREWQGIRSEHDRANGVYSTLERQHGGCCKEALAYEAAVVVPILERLSAVVERISHMVPVTLAGLTAQLTIARAWVGLVDVAYAKGAGARLPFVMLTGAERMVREGMS